MLPHYPGVLELSSSLFTPPAHSPGTLMSCRRCHSSVPLIRLGEEHDTKLRAYGLKAQCFVEEHDLCPVGYTLSDKIYLPLKQIMPENPEN